MHHGIFTSYLHTENTVLHYRAHTLTLDNEVKFDLIIPSLKKSVICKVHVLVR